MDIDEENPKIKDDIPEIFHEMILLHAILEFLEKRKYEEKTFDRSYRLH